MKKLITTILTAAWLLSISCGKDDRRRNNNPYLPVPVINLQLSLNLPEYTPLNFPGNSLVIPGQGVGGLVIYNENNTIYHAFDLSDPNHFPNDCSRMEVNGIEASCPCQDDNRYNIITGQHRDLPGEMYPLQRYQAFREGNVVRVISN